MSLRLGTGSLHIKQHRAALLLSAVLCLFVLSSCLPEPTPLAEIPPTPTVTKTPTATATIVWFPATATFTPIPTREMSPTPDLSPTYGDLLFKDPFTDKTQWQTTRSGAGSIAYGKGELTLAVSAPRGTLLSLRKGPQLSNYYLEIDALPSLCREGDIYGLLLRAASGGDFYRLLVNCNGQLRMERLKNSKAVPLQDWVSSGQIPPGGMMNVRLGVWAQGDEFRVYINDVYHFSVKDPVWTTGTLGVFARSMGDTPLTVNFSNLKVYELSPGQPARPSRTPAPTRTP